MSYEIKLRNPEEDEVLRRIEDRFDVPPIEDSLRDSVVIVDVYKRQIQCLP